MLYYNGEFGKYSVEFVEMTPTRAAYELLFNLSNRPHKNRIVNKYTARMSTDKWVFNGDTICYDEDGNLQDGQHRLMACVKSGKPFLAMIVRGLKKKAFTTKDIGSRRSIADALAIQNESGKLTTLGAAATYQWRVENNIPPYFQNSEAMADIDDALKVLERNPEMRESLQHVKNVGRLMAPALATFLHYQFSRVDKPKADMFFDKLRTGANISEKEPVYKLRGRLQNYNMGSTKLVPKEIMSLVIKAWNLTLENKPAPVRLKTPEDFCSPRGGWYVTSVGMSLK